MSFLPGLISTVLLLRVIYFVFGTFFLLSCVRTTFPLFFSFIVIIVIILSLQLRVFFYHYRVCFECCHGFLNNFLVILMSSVISV